MKKIMLVFGTRPEAIKMAPLVKMFQNNSDKFETLVTVTGQHREMLDQVLNLFEIRPDYDMNIMKKGQDLVYITSSVLLGLREILPKEKPDLVLVHGDTTTSIATALCCFYNKVKVGHVEAGLRTYNIYSPWPEEMNRQLTARLSSFHFAPTSLSRKNLISEGIKESSIIVTGNTVIDALHLVIDKIKTNSSLTQALEISMKDSGYDVSRLANDKKLILITGHRRENFGDGFTNICNAIKILAEKYPNVDFLYPMHLNPNVRKPISEVFGNPKSKLKNVFFIEPLDYLPFVFIMNKAFMVLTDSGGIQEEAPGLGKPVLVMRDTTERPEAVEAGTVKIVGTSLDSIIGNVSFLLDNQVEYERMSHAVNPYGDGKASERIVDFLTDVNL